jgi:hypothetical protein
MTQLDIVTWPSQILWLVVIFHFIYFYIYNIFGRKLFLLRGYRFGSKRIHLTETGNFESKPTLSIIQYVSYCFKNEFLSAI